MLCLLPCTPSYDPLQVLLHCIVHFTAKHLESALSTLEYRDLLDILRLMPYKPSYDLLQALLHSIVHFRATVTGI